MTADPGADPRSLSMGESRRKEGPLEDRASLESDKRVWVIKFTVGSV